MQVLDRENQMDNPCASWLLDLSWDNITELEKLANFHGLITSFEQYPRDWHLWYTSPEPEVASLPGEGATGQIVVSMHFSQNLPSKLKLLVD